MTEAEIPVVVAWVAAHGALYALLVARRILRLFTAV